MASDTPDISTATLALMAGSIAAGIVANPALSASLPTSEQAIATFSYHLAKCILQTMEQDPEI